MSRGLHRTTLDDLAKVVGDDTLFVTTDDGWRQLRVSRAQLAEVLELSRSALHYRLRSLVGAGVARIEATVAFDPARLGAGAAVQPLCGDDPTGLLDETVDRWCTVLVEATRAGDDNTRNRALRVIHSLAEADLSRDLSRDTVAAYGSLSRDAVAAWSRVSSDLDLERENEIDLSSLSSSSVPLSRDVSRDADLSRDTPENPTTCGEPGIPAADRDFGDEETNWPAARAREILEPLHEACERTGAKRVEIPARLLEAMRAWPVSWLERAVRCIVADLEARRIRSPGGVLYRSVHEGWLRHFPAEPADDGPSPWDDPVPAPPDPLAEAAAKIAANRDRANPRATVAELVTACGPDPMLETVAAAVKVADSLMDHIEEDRFDEALQSELAARFGWSVNLLDLIARAAEVA